MIPKIIHYCWFGPKNLTSSEEECLKSWKKIMPDFEVKIWNEDNFDINYCCFTKTAYELGKYAFVSDVARVWVLHQFGGIYLDTDMLLLKPMDELLTNDFFIGDHLPNEVGVGILGSVKEHPFLAQCLEVYGKTKFDPNQLLLIPILFDSVFSQHQFLGIVRYKPEYFYPLPFSKKGEDYSFYITSSTIAVHLWNHSWKDEFGLLREEIGRAHV